MEWVVGIVLMAAAVYFIHREITRKPDEVTRFKPKEDKE